MIIYAAGWAARKSRALLHLARSPLEISAAEKRARALENYSEA